MKISCNIHDLFDFADRIEQQRKDAVAHAVIPPTTVTEYPKLRPDVRADLAAALARYYDGRKIEAIKTFRSITGEGLRESKDAIEMATEYRPDYSSF